MHISLIWGVMFSTQSYAHSQNLQNTTTIHQTVWDQANKDLVTPKETTWQKANRVVITLLSVLIFPIGIALLINHFVYRYLKNLLLPVVARFSPSGYLKEVEKQFNRFWQGPKRIETEEDKLHEELCNTFSKESHIVITPDGAELNVILFRHQKSTGSSIPTIIYFSPNLAIGCEGKIWPLRASIKRNAPCNLVLFDYRSVGNSKGTPFKKAKDFITDGTSIVQWVHNYLQTPADKIGFYGYSLGGAVATLTKARGVVNHENLQGDGAPVEKLTGPLLVDRSFKSITALSNVHYGKGPIGWLVRKFIEHHNLSLDPGKAVPFVEGPKLALYHSQDQLIPKKSSLKKAFKRSETYKLGAIPEYTMEVPPDYLHSAPLCVFTNALHRCEKFLFSHLFHQSPKEHRP